MASDSASSTFLGAIVSRIGREKSAQERNEGTSIVHKRKHDELEGTRQRLFDRNSSTKLTVYKKIKPEKQETEHAEERLSIVQTAEAPENIDVCHDYTTTDGNICPYNKFV